MPMITAIMLYFWPKTFLTCVGLNVILILLSPFNEFFSKLYNFFSILAFPIILFFYWPEFTFSLFGLHIILFFISPNFHYLFCRFGYETEVLVSNFIGNILGFFLALFTTSTPNIEGHYQYIVPTIEKILYIADNDSETDSQYGTKCEQNSNKVETPYKKPIYQKNSNWVETPFKKPSYQENSNWVETPFKKPPYQENSNWVETPFKKPSYQKNSNWVETPFK